MPDNKDVAADSLTRRQRFELLRSQLDTERSSFISHWKDLNDYISPRRGRFQVTDSNRGDRRNQKIIDSTATFSARTLSSGMMSGITSPARPWKRLITPDPDLNEFGAVKIWLHTVNQRMDTVFAKSNLYNALPTVYGDMGTFATAAMMVEEDDEDTIRCYPFPIGSYFLANDRKLRVRTFMRDFRMTVRQMAEQFGYDALSPASKRLWDGNKREIWINVVHVITPNDQYDPSKLESRFKRYLACYYERGTTAGSYSGPDAGNLLEEKGFDEFPVLAPRWAITGEDVYGTDSPGMTVLGDVKQLQMGEKRAMQAIDKMVNPPMIGPPELRSVKASLLPGDVTYLAENDRMKGFRPVHEVKPQIQELEGKQNACRFRIQRGYYEDLFLMLASNPNLDRGDKTAREIEERHEEKLLALGPVIEQLDQDLLDPLVTRTFNIMLRRGEIPEPPQELEGVPLKIEYISIMAQAQKAVGLVAIDRFIGVVNALAAENPEILDKVDTDQIIDEYADATGIPPRLVRPDEEVAQIRQARAKQAQAQQAVATAEQAATAAAKLSQADTGGKNALTDVLSGLSSAQ